MRVLISLILFAASLRAVSADSSDDPMARFAPYVGKWQVRHTLWGAPRSPPEVFEGIADFYFVSNGTVFVVDESTADCRYRFVGYHSYDAGSRRYLNWTASSRIVLAWGDGQWEESREVFRTHRLDPATGKPDPLLGKGVWETVDAKRLVFTALRVEADGTEIPFKEEVYTPLPSNNEMQRTRPAQAAKPRR